MIVRHGANFDIPIIFSHYLTAPPTILPTKPLVATPNLSFFLQSGQYHFVLLGGRSSRPTQERWNHSFSHDVSLSHAIIVPQLMSSHVQ
jgi:hypothetical protein